MARHNGMSSLRLIALVSSFAAGCVIDNGPPPPPPCTTPSALAIDTGATLGYTVGVDAGYYASYATGGHWHLEWTCDTKLSASGCNFTGTITAPANATATGYLLESNDILNVTPGAQSTVAQFDTITTTGVDGVDVTTSPGAAIQIDVMVDGLYQNDIVFVPSGGAALTPACMPTTLTPTAP